MPADRPDPLFLELQTAVAGRYSLEYEIGRGGMGIVFLARDVTLDRPVAIKLLPPELCALAGVRDRFLREARTAARLSHPNIVPIHAVEEAGRLVYFVMAYVPGETLGARVRRQGPVPAGEAGRILRDVAWALAHAHQQGVVHRDIKADNILLETGHRTLVTDFGIAQVAGGTGDEPLAGTIAYMSPEQARGEPVDGRSDLYALGVVGYLILSGTLPDPVGTLDQLRRRHAEGPPASLSTAAPHAPRALCRAIDRCLQPAPENRFQAADEFAAALDQLASSPSELPTPLRTWLVGEDPARAGLLVYTGVLGLTAAGIVVLVIRSGNLVFLDGLIGIAMGCALAWSLYGAARLVRTRKVLAAGYTQNDLVLALRNHAERRREELAFEIGRPPSVLARWLRRGTWAAAAGTVGLFAVSVATGWEMSAGLWLGLAAVAVGGGMLGLFLPGRVMPAKAGPSWPERLWAGPVGRLLVRLAGWRLDRRSAPELTLHRPTEIALGEAAKALFEALPAPYRKDLAGLPEQAEVLSKRAQQLRSQIEELDDLIAQAAPSTMFDGRRPAGDGGAAELIAARGTLARHLADTVTVLESLRVGLLKLHAGTATPETITIDLTAARHLEARLAGLAAARDDLRGELEPDTG